MRGRITRFSRFRGLGSAYDHGQKEVYSASFPEPLLQMQAGHPIYCGRRQNEVYPGCEVDSKGGGQRLKEQGFIRWGGDGSSATGPKNEVYPVVALGLAPKGRFSSRESSSPPGSRSVTRGQNEVYPVCELDSQRGGQRSKNEVYPVRRRMAVPVE